METNLLRGILAINVPQTDLIFEVEMHQNQCTMQGESDYTITFECKFYKFPVRKW